jgi:GNAT superfamily N-acetyltransferase
MLDAVSVQRNCGVNEVRDYWTSLGIDHFVYESEDVIRVSEIRLPKDKRGQGTGTLAMQRLIEYADSIGKRIALSPSKDFGASSVSRLQKFYKKFGFIANKGSHKDYSIRDTMYREPCMTSQQKCRHGARP